LMSVVLIRLVLWLVKILYLKVLLSQSKYMSRGKKGRVERLIMGVLYY
jgi:hypothetical protein